MKESAAGGKGQRLEEEIRRSKLGDIMKMKGDLEKKLMCLQEDAEVLQHGDPSQLKIKMKKDKEYYMLSKEDRQRLKEEVHKKEQEAYEFVKRQGKEDKERKRKLAEKKKRDETALMQRMEEVERKNKEREAEVRQARKEELAKNFEQQKQKREDDLKKQQEQEEKYHKPSVYLYQVLEEQYKKNVLTPMLEEKKQKLAEKRNVLKPVTKEELEEHQKRCEEREVERIKERKSSMHVRREEEARMQEHLKKFHTSIAEKVMERDNREREERLVKLKEKMAVREKMISYASLVKEVCPVVPSEEKAIELQKQIAKIKQPVKQRRDVREQYSLANISKRASRSADPKKEEEEKKVSNSTSRLKCHKKGTTPHCPKHRSGLEDIIAAAAEKRAKEEQEKKHDYLSELRKKRAERYGISKPDRYDWSADIKDHNLAPTEKRERVERKARMIEEQARQKEQLFHIRGGVDKNIEMGQYVSDMFLDAVKAKLAILNSM